MEKKKEAAIAESQAKLAKEEAEKRQAEKQVEKKKNRRRRTRTRRGKRIRGARKQRSECIGRWHRKGRLQHPRLHL